LCPVGHSKVATAEVMALGFLQLSDLFKKCRIFAPLMVATIISKLLLAGDIHSWTVPRNPHDVVVANRGSTQLVVQVIASSLGLLHITVVCLLINYSTRLKFSGASPLDRQSTALEQHIIPTNRLDTSGSFFDPVTLLTRLLHPSSRVVGCCQYSSRCDGFECRGHFSSLIFKFAVFDGKIHKSFRSTLGQQQKSHVRLQPGRSILRLSPSSASSATTIDKSIRQDAKLGNSRFACQVATVDHLVLVHRSVESTTSFFWILLQRRISSHENGY
jgi:hypothetical protein